MTRDAYASIDSDIPSTEELPSNWANDLLKEMGAPENPTNGGSEDEDPEREDSHTTPGPTLEITTFQKAIQYAQQLTLFALEKDEGDLFQQMTLVNDSLQKRVLHSKAKQATIDSFFK